MEVNAWDISGAGVKAILYAATLCASGAVLFECYSAPLLSLAQQRRIRLWVSGCLGVAVATSMVRPLILASAMDESASGMLDGSMIGMVLQGGEARATGIRLLGLALIGGGLWRNKSTMTTALPHGAPAALAGAVMAAVSFAGIGHAWAARNGGLSIALLGLHLVGVAFWVGALMPLFLVGRDGDIETFAVIARRFGEIAVRGVGLLLLAGAALLCTLLSHVADLWNTSYGRLVCVKLAGVCALLSAAAWNKLRLTPRLQRHDRAGFVGLIRSIKAEMLLAALIMGVTATLTSWVGPTR